MNGQDDMNLLRAWTHDRNREALGELIGRHINFVYATARRQVGDAHLAEDITQAVFILLLQKAHYIKSEAAMTSWLFTTTRYAAANATKMLRRRKHYELAAAQISKSNCTADENAELAPLLNDAIDRLPRLDRTCVIMSFLQQKTHREVAMATGISEEAARKRTSRAVEKLRTFFASRGAVVGTGAIVVTLAHQTAAPATIVESTLNVAILAQSAAEMSSASIIAKGVANMLFTVKIKFAAAAVMAMFFTSLVTGQILRSVLTPTAIALDAGADNVPASDPSTVVLDKDLSIQFLGISSYPERDDWRTIDGKPISRPTQRKVNFKADAGPAYLAAVRVHAPEGTGVRCELANTDNWLMSTDDRPGDTIAAFVAKGDTVDLIVNIASEPWKTALVAKPGLSIVAVDGGKINAAFTPLFERDGKAIVYVSMAGQEGPWRLVCKDAGGQLFLGKLTNGVGGERLTAREFSFDAPATTITSIEIQTRLYNQKVTARNINLNPAKPSKPEIVVEKVAK
ncbi:MAG TPA: sigma-70 family RNA polymerase sigma factor [Tepidisphaeraceae bacterium]|nr:sigma-70 family RNA polymerase sigma factor [Tepidisphaeraceae bacterium]